MNHNPCVSDQRCEAVKTEGLDPKDASAVGIHAETPNHTPQNPPPTGEGKDLVERLAQEIQGIAEQWKGANGGIYAIRAMSLDLARVLSSRITTLEGENEKLERAVAAQIQRGNAWRTDSEIANRRIASLTTTLEEVTNILDTFGNLPDALMSPEAWRLHDAEGAIARARSALHQPNKEESHG
ncbi:hypothetical protein [Microvirga sp. Mcv34]|uniref:hypothetical protein n=1 Tax=Microvirga sp. Mcv34 TaxID=2926016 RepID=UPI0021C872AF|nr:hypothetical protein [Microvirga sp. Mcv34]